MTAAIDKPAAPRICANPDCGKDISHRFATTKFCSDPCKRAGAADAATRAIAATASAGVLHAIAAFLRDEGFDVLARDVLEGSWLRFVDGDNVRAIGAEAVKVLADVAAATTVKAVR